MKKNGLHIDRFGTNFWYKKGKLHRLDGPAVIYIDNLQAWYKEGKIHRDIGPAIIYADGEKWWYKEGLAHREDGPAVIYPNGDQSWYKEGEKYEPSAHDLMVYKMNEKENNKNRQHG